MSGTGTASAPIEDTVFEVQGVFPSDAALQKAIGELTLIGLDRAELSLPNVDISPAEATPDQAADNPTTDVDVSQLRNMGTGMAGFAGAATAAGVTVATGGAAGLAIAAAAAVGAGSAALASAGGQAADANQATERDEKGRAGKLILAVRTTDKGNHAQVEDIMRQAGATRVVPVTRADQAVTGGTNASGWTG